MTDYRMIYVTFPNKDDAKRIGLSLLENKLIACLNIMPQIESMYWWEGKIENAKEVVLIAKTTKDLGAEVIQHIEGIHEYECPCIVSMPISSGSKNFLEWIENSTHPLLH